MGITLRHWISNFTRMSKLTCFILRATCALGLPTPALAEVLQLASLRSFAHVLTGPSLEVGTARIVLLFLEVRLRAGQE